MNITMRIPRNTEYDRLMDMTHEDDSLSHWRDMCSWVNDKENRYGIPASSRAYRGYYSARTWYCIIATFQSAYVGFRPAFTLDSDTMGFEPKPGELVTIGTLYMNGNPVRIPKNPTWDGDIAKYIRGAKLELREAMSDRAYQVKAFCVSKGVCVADRTLVRNVSYQQLAEQGLEPGSASAHGLTTLDAKSILVALDINDSVRILTGDYVKDFPEDIPTDSHVRFYAVTRPPLYVRSEGIRAYAEVMEDIRAMLGER